MRMAWARCACILCTASRAAWDSAGLLWWHAQQECAARGTLVPQGRPVSRARPFSRHFKGSGKSLDPCCCADSLELCSGTDRRRLLSESDA
jgi:hypothetical protein